MKVRQYKDILLECLVTLRHARTFVTSREKMHPIGIELYDNLIVEIKEALDAPEPALPVGETSSTPSVALSVDSGRPMTLRECMEAEDGIPFQPMEANTDPLTHQEIFSAVYHHASEIVRLTAAVPTQCTAPSETSSHE